MFDLLNFSRYFLYEAGITVRPEKGTRRSRHLVEAERRRDRAFGPIRKSIGGRDVMQLDHSDKREYLRNPSPTRPRHHKVDTVRVTDGVTDVSASHNLP